MTESTIKTWQNFYPEGVKHTLSYPSATIQALLEHKLLQNPKTKMLNFLGLTVDLLDLERLSTSFATSLNELRLKKGERVLLSMPNSPQFAISLFGILKAGGIPVCIDFLGTADAFEKAIKETEPYIAILCSDLTEEKDLYSAFEAAISKIGKESVAHVITTSLFEILPPIQQVLSGSTFKIKSNRRKETLSWSKLVFEAPNEEKNVESSESDIALIQYKSDNKGVVLTHKNLIGNATQFSSWFALTQSEVILATIPFTSTRGLIPTLLASLVSGAQLSVLPLFLAQEVAKTIEKDSVSFLPVTPKMLDLLALNEETKKRNLSSLKTCVCITGEVPPTIKTNFENTLKESSGSTVKIIECYGLIEACAFTHANSPKAQKTGSIGLPLPDTEVAVLDPDSFRPLDANKEGILAVKGPQVMAGYFNQPGNQPFNSEGWLITTIGVYFDQEGYFYLLGSLEESIVVNGKRIWAHEIEKVLNSHPAVKECSVTILQREKQLKANVVIKPGEKVSVQELVNYCKTKLTPEKIPKQIEIVRELKF
ncbi:hypothetical protein B9Q01_00640 [Candidatus Marsarchaeota G1 archaeon OSP_D]|jgi:Acyl-CoA synthetases (AMP-forming)/AMP-acid ligases II|uniref:AMP-dependent synthetase/ligase domain-containing protein n=2 Tax=Candidatus Marsarchaeota group 1 TaxID=2203770 RepID=A0A2R6ADU2_9ARCH|nr:MAG: hypothetical protein B9Q01_00640 [Candidatus Marsarchaeota G1 archaeon OSP_D]PSN89613.1 MAG: hypothetical protein B9Q00_01105 [Candidatus Marsarchaeota G1 archaeon OSP_C]